MKFCRQSRSAQPPIAPNQFAGHMSQHGQKEKRSKKENGLWKMTPLWKSRKSVDSHRGLEKPSAFPHFPQALLGVFLFI
jgi:hypothetical protein